MFSSIENAPQDVLVTPPFNNLNNESSLDVLPLDAPKAANRLCHHHRLSEHFWPKPILPDERR